MREGVREVEVILRGEAKEIADLVLALQGQRNHEYDPNKVMRQAVRQAIDGIAETKPAT